MISRIFVAPKGSDTRWTIYKKSFGELGLRGQISSIRTIDSYLILSNLSREKLKKAAAALTNPILEQFSINELYTEKCNYVIEIGFLPGVTDNIGHTAEETIKDLLHAEKDSTLAVYTSKVFLISGRINREDIKKIATSLYNPLIERSYIASCPKGAKMRLPLKAPKVILKKSTPVIDVSLAVPDKELIKIGKEGIKGRTGVRRGPLALDLPSMKVIKEHFKKLKRNPTDIELEALAQTWSEHCKHTIFANPIDNIKDGLYKTYIKGATNLIRKNKGRRLGGASKNDFCVSVFSDNSGGIVFDKNYLITHKVETHNSPSALDPFGGAIP